MLIFRTHLKIISSKNARDFEPLIEQLGYTSINKFNVISLGDNNFKVAQELSAIIGTDMEVAFLELEEV
ncbi:MAG: hypothetical protein R3Y46_02735 [Opitutales bacterium]